VKKKAAAAADQRSTGWLDFGPGWLFSTIRDAVIVADAVDGKIVLWNPAATSLFGFDAAEACGMAVHDLVIDRLGRALRPSQDARRCVRRAHPDPAAHAD
jgi:PAS domain-containing protein